MVVINNLLVKICMATTHANALCCFAQNLLDFVHPSGLEPETTVPKTVMISISPRVHILATLVYTKIIYLERNLANKGFIKKLLFE